MVTATVWEQNSDFIYTGDENQGLFLSFSTWTFLVFSNFSFYISCSFHFNFFLVAEEEADLRKKLPSKGKPFVLMGILVSCNLFSRPLVFSRPLRILHYDITWNVVVLGFQKMMFIVSLPSEFCLTYGCCLRSLIGGWFSGGEYFMVMSGWFLVFLRLLGWSALWLI